MVGKGQKKQIEISDVSRSLRKTRPAFRPGCSHSNPNRANENLNLSFLSIAQRRAGERIASDHSPVA
jgi:hypothetical protein